MKRRVQNFQRDSNGPHGGHREVDGDSYSSRDGLYTIHYTKKDVNNIKDTKSLETLSKLDSSIERFVKLLNESIERKKTESAGKSTASKEDGDDDDDKPGEEKLSERPEDNKDEKPEKNGKAGHRDFDEYCKVSEGDFYECLHCPEVSLSVEEFKKHYKERHLKIFYDCLKCGFSTRCYGTMTDHICKYHDNDTSLVKRKIYRVTGLQDDMPVRVEPILTNSQRHRIRQPQQVPVSNQFHNSDSFLQNHKELIIDSDGEKMDYEDSDETDTEMMTNGSGSGSGRYECKVCLQEFTRSERVREHYDAIHLNMVYTCSICGYTNRWKRSVIQHLRSKHEKSPPYKPLMIKKRVENNELQNQPSTSRLAASSDLSHSNDITPCGSSIGGDDDLKKDRGTTEEDGDDNEDFLDVDLQNDDFGDIDDGDDAEEDENAAADITDLDDLDDNDDERGIYDATDDSKSDFLAHPNSSSSCKLTSDSSHFSSLVTWVCRKCGFSHKWRLILTNHLRTFHKLKPPFDQFLLQKTEPAPNNPAGSGTKAKLSLAGDEDDDDDIFSDDIIELPSRSTEEYNLPSPSYLGINNHYSLVKAPVQSQLTPSSVGQVYPCNICHKSFDTLKGLKEHHEGMHTDMVWACKLCSFTDRWRPQAVSHVRHKHGCGPPYNDHIFRKKSSDSSSHSRPHRASSSGNFIPQSSIPSTSSGITKKPNSNALNLTAASGVRKSQENAKEDKINLKECHIKLSDDQYQCTQCSKTCGSAQGITEHYEAFHLNMAYICQLCDFTDVWRSMMTKHLRQKHQLGKPYDEYLRRVKLDPVTRQQIEDGHSIPKEQTFHKRRSVGSNGTPHKNVENSTPSKSNLSTPPATPRIHLKNTPKSTSKAYPKSQPKVQTKSDHRPDIKVDPEELGKQYTHHDKQLRCKQCGSSFTSLQGFQEHYEAIHLDVIWTCRKCNTSFRWRQQLTKHLKLVHKCEPPFNEYMFKETGSHKLKRPIPDRSQTNTPKRRSTNQSKREITMDRPSAESKDSTNSPSQDMEYSDKSPEPPTSAEDLSMNEL